MKRITSLVLSLLLIAGLFALPVSAKATLKIEVEAKGENSYEITLSVSGSIKTASLGVDFANLKKKDGVTVEKGKWLLSDAMLSDVDLKGGAAVLAFTSEQTVKGEIFRLTVKTEGKPDFGKASLEAVYSNGKEKLTATLSDSAFPVSGAEEAPKATKDTTPEAPSETEKPDVTQTAPPEQNETAEPTPADPAPETQDATEPSEGTDEPEAAIPEESLPEKDGKNDEGTGGNEILIVLGAVALVALFVVGIILLRKKMP